MIVTERVRTEPFVVALPRDHRLAGRRSVDLSDLAHEPFVISSRELTPYCHSLTIDACRDAGFVPNVRHDGDHPQTLLSLVGLGLGIALVPASHGEVEPPDVVFKPLRRPYRMLETLMAWRRGTQPTVQAFLRVARDLVGANEAFPEPATQTSRMTTIGSTRPAAHAGR